MIWLLVGIWRKPLSDLMQKFLKRNVHIHIKKLHILNDNVNLCRHLVDLVKLHGKQIFLFMFGLASADTDRSSYGSDRCPPHSEAG